MLLSNYIPKGYLAKIVSNESLAAFCLIFVFYLWYLTTTTYDYLTFDAKEYWTLGQKFIVNGEFSFLNFNNGIRGYLFPLLNLPLYLFWEASGIELFAVIKIFGALTAATLFGLAIPWLIKNNTSFKRVTLYQRLLIAGLGFFFWRDHFNFPLSDFPAFLFIVICTGILSGRYGFVWHIIAGLFFGAVLNLRPTYAICVPFVLLFLLLNNSTVDKRKLWLKFSAFFLGFLLISLPQLIINYNLKDSFSSLVQTSIGIENRSLYLSQLEWGIVFQKYETSLDPSYISPGMLFIDPKGIEFVRENNFQIEFQFVKGSINSIYGIPNDNLKSIETFGQYFNLVINNPIDFFQIYLKHIFNGFDIQYSSPYIKNIFQVNYFLIIVNFTVLFFASIIFWFRISPYLNAKHITLLLIFSSPCLVAIPTAIEVRYFLPLHIMAYAAVAFGWPKKWRNIISFRNTIFLLSFYLIFMSVCLLVSNQNQQTLLYTPRYLF